MLQVGIVGWRGMVGSVLIQRMREENDFALIEPVFFSTSQAGGQGPAIGRTIGPVQDANDLKVLASLPVIISCQGGDYTNAIHPKLRAAGWKGYWIDAASALRMQDQAVIILDPVNMPVITRALDAGLRDFIGGNCTVSLMMMALDGLFKNNLIEWISSMTYQAASGAGAAQMRELVEQMTYLGTQANTLMADPASSALAIDQVVTRALHCDAFPKTQFGYPLAASLLPWIDKDLGNGQSREEWKGQAETNKILGRTTEPLAVDGICVRVSSMRCHSQGLTVKLKKDVPIAEIESMLAAGNSWVDVVPNRREESLAQLTPAQVSGTLRVPIGRLRKMSMGPTYIAAFTVGDQLLWGAAEPLRRMLRVLLTRGI